MTARAQVVWDGDDLASHIAQHLIEKGFAPFGLGLPYAASRVAREFLRDFEFANAVACDVSMDTNTVLDVLASAAQQIEEREA